MSMNSRAIALQGIGYGTRLVALQGLVAAAVQPPDLADPFQGLPGGGPWSQISASEWRRRQTPAVQTPALAATPGRSSKRRRREEEVLLMLTRLH